jgi:cell division protein FtsI/penicillin-binding protein 2
MQNSKDLKSFACFISLLLFVCPVSAGNPAREEILRHFDEKYGGIGVIVIEAGSAKIEYIFNEPLVTSRRFPAGSIMKPLTAAVMFDHNGKNGFSADAPVLCGGKFFPFVKNAPSSSDQKIFNIQTDENGRMFFKCSVRAGHGSTGLPSALIHSCNVFFLTKADQWDGCYDKLISSWGILKDPETGRLYMHDAATPFQQVLACIGEGGERISVLKAAQCYNSLFTGAPLIVPDREGKGKVISDVEVMRSSRERVTAILSSVSRTGTLKAFNLENSGVRILAAKTGTATHYRKKYDLHGWNVLLFEYSGKKMILVSFVTNGSGSKQAADVSSSVLNSWGIAK